MTRAGYFPFRIIGVEPTTTDLEVIALPLSYTLDWPHEAPGAGVITLSSNNLPPRTSLAIPLAIAGRPALFVTTGYAATKRSSPQDAQPAPHLENCCSMCCPNEAFAPTRLTWHSSEGRNSLDKNVRSMCVGDSTPFGLSAIENAIVLYRVPAHRLALPNRGDSDGC